MAKGMLGKSRPSPESQSISKPVLKYTDALPRNDLRQIEGGISYSRPIHQVVKAGQRPGTPSGYSTKRKPGAPAPGFDFQITVPPADIALAPSETVRALDESMIGIALGSPRLLESQTPTALAHPYPPPTPPDVDGPSSALQRKSSKWRKIGGLFKAKNAVASNVNKPFYQVRAETETPSQGSSHSIDCKSRQRAGSKTEPIENTELWPCLVSEQEAIMQKQASTSPSAPGSLLQVEIPKVEMERYSVMFGGLLNNSRPSLLNRRSKTLDDVATSGTEVLTMASPPLGPPRRRATSPTRSRSPNFTLFPTTPSSKASKVLGSQNLPQVPDSLRRAQPAAEAPSQETGTSQSMPKVENDSKAQSSHRPQSSVTSFLSSTSIGSDDEPLLIHKIEPIRTFAGMKEPNWEMINRKTSVGNPPQPTTKKLVVNTRELRSNSGSSTSTTASSPILSPLNSIRTGVSPVGNNVTPTILPPPGKYPPEEDPIPTIEVSVARSISVSKGKKQVLVPVRTRTRTGHLNSNERLVARQVRTPQVTGGKSAHRPGFSQDVRIELA
ncbi:hypothetical protein BJX63DRAFT_58622 [Aspergillus granulosus]|uniref:Uncharacterized protein n=1 Tax=Aspergillus granulosus TaxID=176169 RepID=A0ABR4HT09_9EURO